MQLIGFTAEVDRKIAAAEERLEQEGLDRRVEFLCTTILEAADAFIGRTKANRSRKSWLSREVRAAIRERNALRRLVSSRREEWLEACRKVQDLVREAKEKSWHDFVQELEVDTDPVKVWRVIRSLSGSAEQNLASNEVLVVNGKEISTAQRKAEAFNRHYAAVGRGSLTKEERCRGKDIRRRLRATREDRVTEEVAPFSGVELSVALSSLKGRSTGGADRIAPRFLKALGPVARELLLGCFNTSWEEGKCPQAWRNGTIIPLLKAGKPVSRIDSYRPVCLTSYLAKTMEKMVVNRLQHLAEARGWWCSEQAGFRKRRSCEDQVIRLAQSISDGFQARPSNRTVLALLDYSKAYDTVWRDGLLGALMDSGVPGRFVRWVDGFLRNRQSRVEFDGTSGRYKKFAQGLPQGSVLSPILFLFYINSVRNVIPEGVNVSMYADDVAVWAQDAKKERAAAKVEVAIQAISRWSADSKLSLNAGKCEISFFSTDPREASWAPQVRLGGAELRYEPAPRFLGVTFDRTLTFRPHAEKIAAKVGKRCRVLAALAGQNWGWSRDSLVRVYKTYSVHPTSDGLLRGRLAAVASSQYHRYSNKSTE